MCRAEDVEMVAFLLLALSIQVSVVNVFGDYKDMYVMRKETQSVSIKLMRFARYFDVTLHCHHIRQSNQYIFVGGPQFNV